MNLAITPCAHKIYNWRFYLIPIFLEVLFFFNVQNVIANEKFDDEKYAYETYVGCYNQLSSSSDNSCKTDGLSIDLIRCADLALTALERSKSPIALRYIAYLQLLKTDGGVKYSNNVVAFKKSLAIKPYLIEARKSAGKNSCLVAGIKLDGKPAKNLCSSEEDAKRDIDELLSKISKSALQKKR